MVKHLIKCPLCKKRTESILTAPGSPLRFCVSCKAVFYGIEYEEVI